MNGETWHGSNSTPWVGGRHPRDKNLSQARNSTGWAISVLADAHPPEFWSSLAVAASGALGRAAAQAGEALPSEEQPFWPFLAPRLRRYAAEKCGLEAAVAEGSPPWQQRVGQAWVKATSGEENQLRLSKFCRKCYAAECRLLEKLATGAK